MPSYSLGQIMSLATTRSGRRADVGLSDVSLYANMAYMEVADKAPHALLEQLAISSTTTGENKIDLPEDFGEPITFSLVYMPSWSTSSSQYSSHITLTRISIEEASATNPQPSGVPEKFALFNNWAELFPSPNSGYSFYARYKSAVTDLLETSQVPSLATPWRHAIMLKTEAYVAHHVKDYVAEAAAERAYLSYVDSLKDTEARRQSGQYRLYMTPHNYGGHGRRRV